MNYIKYKQIMENIKLNEDKLPYIECEHGWDPLIERAIKLVNQYNEDHSSEIPIEFTQIKEKWGYLNFYLNYYPKDLHRQLLQIERESKTICENCGNPTKTREYHHWYYTLCDTCMEDIINRWKNIYNS